MLRSMTGFGQASIETKEGLFIIELQSVNRRFLESSIFLPKEFFNFEIELKKVISKKISRGQILLKLNFYPSEKKLRQSLPDAGILKNLKKGWEDIAKKLNIEKKEIDLNFLIQELKGVSNIKKPKDVTNEKKVILKCLEEALKLLIVMKEKEGFVLVKDIDKRLKLIEMLILKIEKKAKDAPKAYEEKLKKRLSEFLTEKIKDDERIFKEIAIFSEKVDITEEIIRLKYHVKQFYSLLKDKKTSGKKLDFLLQEMLRETNTIASKSLNKDIATYVIDIKSELEKIKEQTQNIE